MATGSETDKEFEHVESSPKASSTPPKPKEGHKKEKKTKEVYTEPGTERKWHSGAKAKRSKVRDMFKPDPDWDRMLRTHYGVSTTIMLRWKRNGSTYQILFTQPCPGIEGDEYSAQIGNTMSSIWNEVVKHTDKNGSILLWEMSLWKAGKKDPVDSLGITVDLRDPLSFLNIGAEDNVTLAQTYTAQVRLNQSLTEQVEMIQEERKQITLQFVALLGVIPEALQQSLAITKQANTTMVDSGNLQRKLQEELNTRDKMVAKALYDTARFEAASKLAGDFMSAATGEFGASIVDLFAKNQATKTPETLQECAAEFLSNWNHTMLKAVGPEVFESVANSLHSSINALSEEEAIDPILDAFEHVKSMGESLQNAMTSRQKVIANLMLARIKGHRAKEQQESK